MGLKKLQPLELSSRLGIGLRKAFQSRIGGAPATNGLAFISGVLAAQAEGDAANAQHWLEMVEVIDAFVEEDA